MRRGVEEIPDAPSGHIGVGPILPLSLGLEGLVALSRASGLKYDNSVSCALRYTAFFDEQIGVTEYF